MAYRPMTPIKGPGIAAVSELYEEQQDARAGQVDGEAKARAADATRGRRRARIVGAALVALLALVTVAFAVWPRGSGAATPTGVSTLAVLAGTATPTTTFDGQRYTITFVAANPSLLLFQGREFAAKHGYVFDTPSDPRIAFDIAGPQGGIAVGYFDGGGQPNTTVRIVVAASDLTADGSGLR